MTTTTDELCSQITSLRETTRHADQKASLLLLAPGGALAAAGLLTDLTGEARTLGAWALILAVAMAAPIGAALLPRRPRSLQRRQSRAEIIAAAQQRAAGSATTEALHAAEVQRLQAILAAKWGWIELAIFLGALALITAAAAVISATN